MIDLPVLCDISLAVLIPILTVFSRPTCLNPLTADPDYIHFLFFISTLHISF